ncbi:DUF1822 family protein [Roseofilum sp. BLCC_M91]|uniref:DUF1822 family protein n=1 Tax=Roseofilum halophilum BLCC-M91 TaxID=3022259 RepID=A0ABT7BMT7_9CYAN|nr:DUF1822 family protein [Roseofilum halophilum]MDJ1180493.1 DUF1822 family protein [Roseofilum halophilum BLCC-M91]
MNQLDLDTKLQSLDDEKREILELILSGETQVKISEKINLSEDSLKDKIEDIYRYFGVGNDDTRKRQKFFLISLFFKCKIDMVHIEAFKYHTTSGSRSSHLGELDKTINKLQKEEYKILELFLQNDTPQEIACKCNLGENGDKKVRNDLRKMCSSFHIQEANINYLIVLFFRYKPEMVQIPPLSDPSITASPCLSGVEAKEGIEIDNFQISLEDVDNRTQNKKQWRLIIQSDEYNETLLKTIENFVQNLTEDGTQKVIKISKGSIVIEFEGSPEGFERIKALFDSGELTEIAGFPIQEISALAEQQTQPTQLSEWLQGVFAPLWESVDGLFTPEQLRFAFRQRTEGVSRRKTIVFNELEDRQVELVATIIPVEMPRVKVMVQIVPSAGVTHLPEDLHIQLVDESDAENPEGEVFEAQENLEFNAEVGDAFSIIVEQGRFRVVERFMV